MFLTISKLFRKLFVSLLSTDPAQVIFCRFPSNFLHGFCLLVLVRLFFPFFFSLISFFMHLKEIFGLHKFGVFDVLVNFFHNWSMGFCCWMILTCSSWFNLINLMNWEKLKFIGLENTWIWDFIQLSIHWWNWLVLLINFINIYCYLTYVMIIWSICWDFWKWVFKIWGFWYKLYVQANSVIFKV